MNRPHLGAGQDLALCVAPILVEAARNRDAGYHEIVAALEILVAAVREAGRRQGFHVPLFRVRPRPP